jgi:hypothetical protein
LPVQARHVLARSSHPPTLVPVPPRAVGLVGNLSKAVQGGPQPAYCRNEMRYNRPLHQEAEAMPATCNVPYVIHKQHNPRVGGSCSYHGSPDRGVASTRRAALAEQNLVLTTAKLPRQYRTSTKPGHRRGILYLLVRMGAAVDEDAVSPRSNYIKPPRPRLGYTFSSSSSPAQQPHQDNHPEQTISTFLTTTFNYRLKPSLPYHHKPKLPTYQPTPTKWLP